MDEVMLRGLPTPLKGALVVPKYHKLEWMCLTERSLQPAMSAIWAVVSEILRIMSRMATRVPTMCELRLGEANFARDCIVKRFIV